MSETNNELQEQVDLLYKMVKSQQELIELIMSRLDIQSEALEKIVNIWIKAATEE